MLLLRLNLKPSISEEELVEIISASEDPEVNKLNNLRNYLLDDMQPPEEYTVDRLNRYCLFTEKGFLARVMFFEILAGCVENLSPKLSLIFTEVKLPPEVILYQDEQQIVVTKETYKTYTPSKHHDFSDDDVERIGYDCFDDEDE